MRLLYLAFTVTLLAISCAAPSATRTIQSATPRATTAPTPDYRGMRQSLVLPLGALIVAVRNNDRTNAATHIAQFKEASEKISPVIASDMSKQANALHSAIANVPTHPTNLAALEDDRQHLLQDIP